MDWIERQAKAFQQRPDLFPKGEVSHIAVRHDDWCGLLVHVSRCDCKPDLWFEHEGTKYAITPKGNVVRR